ncbi:protein DYAD-like, partial [Trifolium medium]|nr:protein DYAD-like [Trifolium medium]
MLKPGLLLGPATLAQNIGEEASEDVKGTNDKETKSADTQMVLSSKAELRAANMSVSPNLLTNLDEHTMVPTPTSAPKLV